MVQTRANDKVEQRVLNDIRELGWHVVSVPEDDEGPGFAYSIGFFQTFQHPEIIVFGLEPLVGVELLNSLGKSIQGGQRLSHQQILDDPAARQKRQFMTVLHDSSRKYLGFAHWYYEGTEYPVLQCLWSDRQGVLPLDPTCDEFARDSQPILFKRPVWRFRESPDTACFTTRYVVENQSPVLHVYHDEEGDWQFLSGHEIQTSDAKLISLQEMISLSPDMEDLWNLPLGWMAKRSRPDKPWQRMPIR